MSTFTEEVVVSNSSVSKTGWLIAGFVVFGFMFFYYNNVLQFFN